MTQERPPNRSGSDAARLAGSGHAGGVGHRRAMTPSNGSAIEDPFDAPPGPDYDALADLFLGESDAPAPSSGAKAALRAPGPVLKVVSGEEDEPDDAEPGVTPPLIEGLIIGHLPVLASAWATQYARHLAEESGAWVGLLKLRAGQCSVEVVGPARGDPPLRDGAPPAARDTLEGGIGEAARVAGRWLLRVDELTEPRLAELPGLDATTLLTGADEAAVVASYRTLKLLAERAGEDDHAPRLGVAIMGASPERAREAAARLARTVEVHLGRSLPLAACIARIGPGRSIALYRGEQRDSADAMLPRIIEAIRAAAQPAPSKPVEPPPAPAAPAPAAHPVPVADNTPAPAITPPKPQSVGDHLAGHIAGLKPLPAACPYAPGVELAVDAAGRVHVLARMDGADGHLLGHLLAASAWAGSHALWIRLASGTPVAEDDAVMHVFSEEPKGARRLLDSRVRVHLLARVRLGDREGWVCKDLN